MKHPAGQGSTRGGREAAASVVPPVRSLDGIVSGGCLCGALRYRAAGRPRFAGYCCCRDCQRASGSGFVPFIGYAASALWIDGATRQVQTVAIHGGPSVRNFCAHCGSLVFGGLYGSDEGHTIYAGSLDDPADFQPTMAIFVRDKPDWVELPAGLEEHQTLPR